MVNSRTLSIIIGAAFMVSGCGFSPDISDPHLEDRVVACSGGFTRSTAASLQAAYNKAAIQGEVSLGFKEDAQSIIFSELTELPEAARLKAYEDYIRCIEQDWNTKE